MPLIFSQYHNFKENRLQLRHCPTVESTDFSDVLITFYRLQPLSPNPRYGFHEFTLQYPNIRKVVLSGPPLRQPVPTASRLIDFLKECRGLTELKLQWTGFSTVDFYRHLTLIPSLRTLETLYVHEDPGRFAERNEEIDFHFYLIIFQYLHRLHTNMVPKEKALGYLDQMRIGSELNFMYNHRELEDVHFHVQTRRFDKPANVDRQSDCSDWESTHADADGRPESEYQPLNTADQPPDSAEYEVFYRQQGFITDPMMPCFLDMTDTLDGAKRIVQKHLENAKEFSASSPCFF